MSALSCRGCGNTQHWAGLVIDHAGIRVQCGRCGQVVTSTQGASGGSIAMSNLTVTGPAVVGEGATVVGSQRRPSPRPTPRPAAEPRYEVEDGQRYLVVDGRRWAVREPATQPAAPPPTSVPQRPADHPTEPDPVADSADPHPRPGGTASASPWSSPPNARPAAPPATADVPSEITGLPSAQRYAQGMSIALDGQAPTIEIFVGVLRESDVSGDAVTCAVRAQELTGQASQAWRAADSALARQHTVREAYAAVPEAGTKSWLRPG